MNRSERLLVLILRLGAALLLLSLAPALMPFSWMQAIHRALGMGELIETPLNHYLTRSLSALYAVHGALLLYLSFDVRRYRSLIGFLGAANVVFGGFMIGLDLVAGMPPVWTLAEGPFILASGLLLLGLQRGVTAPGRGAG